MTTPYKLEPRQLRDVWDEIRPGLDHLRRMWPELCTWRSEDVYAAVLQEQAVIYTSEDGFAVCTTETDPYSLRTDLFIWIAYAWDGRRGGMLKKYLQSFIEVAKSLGFSGVCTDSNHPALANEDELEPLYTRYRVNVDG